MDSLTHLVMGHAMGTFAGGATAAVQAGAYWGALIGNSLPDIDVPVGYLLGRGWAFHRKFTHTVPGVLGLSLSAAGLITLAVPGSAFLTTWVWTLVGCVIHVLVDCLNLFGVRPLWPFSAKAVGLGVLFIMDPLILGGLGLGSIAHLAGWVPASVLQSLYTLMWAYVIARWAIQVRLGQLVRGRGVLRFHVVPYFAFYRYFLETRSRMEYGRIQVLSGRLLPMEAVETSNSPAVDASRADPKVKEFLGRARYPFARVERIAEGRRVIWEDLFMRLRGWRSGVEVLLDENLRPLG